MMLPLPSKPWLRLVAGAAAVMLASGCATTQKISAAELDALGIRTGTPHWEATAPLSRQGYACFVSGARREEFDCAKTTGLLVSCISRVRFTVDDQNKIATINVPEPACIGTP